jgi:hypothetical protein
VRSRRVLCQDDGQPPGKSEPDAADCQAEECQARHTLRHSFHLAAGGPPRAIQELARHSDPDDPEIYMHLSPAALDAAIRLFDGRGKNRGNAAQQYLETRNVRDLTIYWR